MGRHRDSLESRPMTTQAALAALAAFLGFAASVFFVIGTVRLDAKLIHQLASPRWDFHAEIARHLAGQKADYMWGSVLLLVAFVGQAISMAPLSFNQTILFSSNEIGFMACAVVAAGIWFAAVLLCRRSGDATFRLVDKLAQEAREREERELRQRKAQTP